MSCAPSWIHPEDVSYNVFLFTLGFFIPFTIIIITSLIVIVTLRRSYANITSADVKTCALSRQLKVIKMVISATYSEQLCTG